MAHVFTTDPNYCRERDGAVVDKENVSVFEMGMN